MWVAYAKGLVEQYTETGRRLGWYHLAPGITCLAAVGGGCWAGGLDGRLWELPGGGGGSRASSGGAVAGARQQPVRSWRAHAHKVKR